MKKNVIISIIIIATIIGGYLWLSGGGQNIIGNSTIYTNSTYGFSLKLPEGMQASSFAEGEGEIVLITNDKLLMTNGGQDFQMQIYVSPFDEDIVLTAERIKNDLPEMKMESIGEAKWGKYRLFLLFPPTKSGKKQAKFGS